MAMASTMRMGAEGIKVQISGRLNGAEMARSESFKEGRIHCQLSEQISITTLVKHYLR
jgi:ribosomal protein S3